MLGIMPIYIYIYTYIEIVSNIIALSEALSCYYCYYHHYHYHHYYYYYYHYHNLCLLYRGRRQLAARQANLAVEHLVEAGLRALFLIIVYLFLFSGERGASLFVRVCRLA